MKYLDDKTFTEAWKSVFGNNNLQYDRNHYFCNDYDILVPIGLIKPPERSTSMAYPFKIEKLLNILIQIKEKQIIHAVEAERINDDKYSHAVHNGFHRYYISIKSNFKILPIRIVDI